MKGKRKETKRQRDIWGGGGMYRHSPVDITVVEEMEERGRNLHQDRQ